MSMIKSKIKKSGSLANVFRLDLRFITTVLLDLLKEYR